MAIIRQEEIDRLQPGSYGPSVWPRVFADQAPDRFIHGYPEVRYLGAVATSLEIFKTTGDIQTFVYRVTPRSDVRKSRVETVGRFSHVVITKSPTEDVIQWLTELRLYLQRHFPKGPLWGTRVRLTFKDSRNTRKVLAQYTKEWS